MRPVRITRVASSVWRWGRRPMFSGKNLKVRNEGGGDRAELIIGGTSRTSRTSCTAGTILALLRVRRTILFYSASPRCRVQLGAVYFTRHFLTLIFKFEVCCILRRLVMEARAGSRAGSPGRQSPTTGEQRTSSKDISSSRPWRRWIWRSSETC